MPDKETPVFFTFTAPIRAGFLNVIDARQFKPKGGKPSGDPRFDGAFMIAPDHPDLAALKALAVPMLQAIHPGKKVVGHRLTQEELDGGNTYEVVVPWRDGTKLADKAKAEQPPKDQEFFRGLTVLKVTSKYPPALSGVENGKFAEYDDPAVRASMKRLFYAGAWFVPYVKLHSYKPQEGKPGGVGLWLSALMFAKNDKRIGGAGVNSADVFKGYAGKLVAEDPTAGGASADDEQW